MVDMQTTVWLVFAFWNSVADIRNKKISLLSCLLATIVGGLLLVFEENSSGGGLLSILTVFVLRSLPGLILLIFSYVGQGAVGAGDGLIVLVSGWFLGTAVTIEIVFWGLFSSALFGIGMMLWGKAKRKTEIPFVPFMLLGYFIRKGMLNL